MNKLWTLCWLLLALAGSLSGGEIFPHHIYTTEVQTLQCQVWRDGEPIAIPYPIARLASSDEEIVVSFDLEDPIPHRIHYLLELCDADWQVNDRMALSEYIDGWIGARWQTDESAPSEATSVAYRHYELRLGGASVLQPLLSGNYRLTAWCEELQEEPIFVTSFALYEPLADVAQQVVPTTPEGNYSRFQQVELELTFPSTLTTDPLTELLVTIGQNGSSTRYQRLTRPTSLAPGRLTFRGHDGATFAAGNEWRAYEILSPYEANMGVEHLNSQETPPVAFLYLDHPTNGSYITVSDANGYRKVRQTDYDPYYDETMTDYYLVTWRLALDDPLRYGTPFIEGATFDALPKEQRTLRYNRETGYFELSLLVKGGYVSYRYSTSPSPAPLASNAIEGDYYQTENQYTTLVYLTSPMLRYQKLVAVE